VPDWNLGETPIVASRQSHRETPHHPKSWPPTFRSRQPLPTAAFETLCFVFEQVRIMPNAQWPKVAGVLIGNND